MMNINIIPPVDGYLERVRELCTAHGVKLIFDEVKTGATIARGGATQRFGVQPDMITLAKAICGGYPGGAVGMTEEIAALIADGRVHQYGTFNGNPLVMAAAEAALTEVLTEDAYRKLESSNDWLLGRCDEIIERYGLPCYTRGNRRQGLRDLRRRAAARVPRLPDQGRRRARDPGLALPHEPRRLHDPGRRGGVDAVDRALRAGPAAVRRRAGGVREGRHRGLSRGATAGMAGGPSIRLYRAEWSTNCERVGLALAHKGIGAQSVLIDYGDRRPVEAVSGQGLVPVIEDAGEVVNDSVAILRHLERRLPGAGRCSPPIRLAAPRSTCSSSGSSGSTRRLRTRSRTSSSGGDPDRELIERRGAEMGARLDVFEGLLSGSDYMLNGELTAADCVAYPFLKYALGRDPADTETFHVVLDEHQPLGDAHPSLRAWIERIGGAAARLLRPG